MLAAIDSFYQHVRARVVALNASRQFKGIIEAQDWPQQEVVSDAFYLLSLPGASPMPESSPSSPLMIITVQWVWAIFGDDVGSTERGRNRGDRYRVNQAMREELLHGLYPYYAEKKTWSVTAGTGALVSASFNPALHFSWGIPTFTDRVDEASGLVYGVARVGVSDFTEAIAA